jgi:hypothetical protein
MKLLLKITKTIVGVILIPFAVGSISALWQVVFAGGQSGFDWILMLIGSAVFVLVYFFTSKPDWIYVLGHELTHALWSFSFGGRLKQIRVHSDGGHVVTTKSNFLTSLSPYFFPLYTVLVIVIFGLGGIFWDWSSFIWIFYLLIGLTYTFHILMNIHILKNKQPDIVQHGYIFSSVIIFIGNISTLLIGLALLSTEVNLQMVIGSWVGSSLDMYHSLFGLFGI